MLAFLLYSHGLIWAQRSSSLHFSSSDVRLQQTFEWAKKQALAYVSTGNDPVKLWYEAALPGRNAFCMRDVSHQVSGAAALGLAENNKSMLKLFAQNISPSRDWASYWEIDRDGKPSAADYRTDSDFWYNLPANFDVMTAALRMYRWTGDSSYITSPTFLNFYSHTLSDFIPAWQLQPEKVLTRVRILNRRQSTGQFVDSRGIPSYTEGQKDFTIGLDTLAAEYRALRSYAELQKARGSSTSAAFYEKQANALEHVIETVGWNASGHHFYGFLRRDGTGFGSGDAFILYFHAVQERDKMRAAGEEIKKQSRQPSPGIEEQSYRPEILYGIDAPEEAYDQIMDLSHPGRARREYPEVSFAILGSMVSGMMGVEVAPSKDSSSPNSFVLQTLARLSSRTAWAEIDGLPVHEHVIGIRHNGNKSSTLHSRSGNDLTWQPEFHGEGQTLHVNGRSVRASRLYSTTDGPMIYTDVVVHPGESITVSR